MNLIERFTKDLSSRRAQHLVYLLHVWLCVPFLFFWVADKRTKVLYGSQSIIEHLRILVFVMLVYMVVRSWLAYKDPPKLKWWYVFPPIDVAFITVILLTTQRGPMSNITLLYFLPMVLASGTLNVRWSAAVGLMVVVGTSLATLTADPSAAFTAPTSLTELLHDPLNVSFRVCFLLIVSSLMAYQVLIASGYRERLGIAADRNRIAMDMHDGVQGHLISIASQLELISRVAEKDGKRAAELALEGRESARQAADELRFLVQRLRTPTLTSGFVGALKQYAHNICERNGLSLVFEIIGAEPTLEGDIENALFRIAQEALTNIVKHAHAHAVSIVLTISEANVSLLIADNGVGFDPSGREAGVGLEGMRTRAAENGGKLTVESSRGEGTRLNVTFKLGAKND